MTSLDQTVLIIFVNNIYIYIYIYTLGILVDFDIENYTWVLVIS